MPAKRRIIKKIQLAQLNWISMLFGTKEDAEMSEKSKHWPKVLKVKLHWRRINKHGRKIKCMGERRSNMKESHKKKMYRNSLGGTFFSCSFLCNIIRQRESHHFKNRCKQKVHWRCPKHFVSDDNHHEIAPKFNDLLFYGIMEWSISNFRGCAFFLFFLSLSLWPNLLPWITTI